MIQSPSRIFSKGVNAGRTLRSLDWALVTVLILCAVLPYANTPLNSFVYDDRFQILQNPYVVSFHYVRKIFTTSVWSFVPAKVSNYYRPLMTLGYLFCFKIFAFAPWGFP